MQHKMDILSSDKNKFDAAWQQRLEKYAKYSYSPRHVKSGVFLPSILT